MLYGFPYIPGPFLAAYHRKVGTALMMCCYYSYYKACRTDPGYITQRTHRDAMRRFKFDKIMYEPKQKCRTCKFDKPARSKHCSLCDMCVEAMDHHCVWINQCVGLRNYKYFISFLFLHAWLCTYGAVAGVLILYGKTLEPINLW